jgi:hypothetical protein
MLSDEQIYEAKVFMRSYADALTCLQQVARKEVTYNHFKHYYSNLKSDETPPELKKTLNNLFQFSRGHIRQYLKPEPSTADELRAKLDKMIQDIAMKIHRTNT